MSEVLTLSPPPASPSLPSPACGGGLVSAIAAVMNDVHTVAKRGENKFHGYRYAAMGDILKEITPLLGRHGIVIFQSETGRAMFDDDNVIAVEYAFTVAHASGETWPQPLRQTGVSTCRNPKGGWDDKSLNKCHTAARKYFLLSLFQIPTGDEDDADRSENDRPSNAIASKPAYVVPPPSRRLKDGPVLIDRSPKQALKPGGIAERAIATRYEQAVRSVGPSQPFLASEAGRFDERNPPPHIHDVIADQAAAVLNRRLHPMSDELPGDLGPRKLNTSERDGVPAFLDRRASAEPSYVDLVEGRR